MLILLMCSTHALMLSGVPQESWLYTMWLPRGWGTHGFVIVSGFGLAYFFGAGLNHGRCVWARHRAGQLFGIAVLSNLLFGAASDLVTGDAAALATAEWWVRHVVFWEPYSISAVLYPTAAILAVLPRLARASRDVGAFALVLSTLLLVLAAGGVSTIQMDHPVWARVVSPGLGGFPLLRMFTEGILGYALGLWVRRDPTMSQALLLGTVALMAVGGAHDWRWLDGWLAVGRVGLIAALTYAASLGVRREWLLSPLVLLGRYPLQAFLGHRAVEQALAHTVAPLLGGGVLVYWVLFAGAIGAIGTAAMARVALPRLDRRLAGLWL